MDHRTLNIGAHIKNRSVTRIDLAKNTLTGTEINEAQLGQVPASVQANLLGGKPASVHSSGRTRIEYGTSALAGLTGGQTRVLSPILASGSE